jgi:hypothetical protein
VDDVECAGNHRDMCVCGGVFGLCVLIVSWRVMPVANENKERTDMRVHVCVYVGVECALGWPNSNSVCVCLGSGHVQIILLVIWHQNSAQIGKGAGSILGLGMYFGWHGFSLPPYVHAPETLFEPTTPLEDAQRPCIEHDNKQVFL